MNRRTFLLQAVPAATLIVAGCAAGNLCDPTLPGCAEYEGVAEAGETQWDLIRRLWPEYAEGNLAFQIFDEYEGYNFPDETDFDANWNLIFQGGEQVRFLSTTSIT